MKGSFKSPVAAVVVAVIIVSGFVFFRHSSDDERGNKSEYISVEGIIWHTNYHMTYRGPVGLADSILNVLHDVESSVSVFMPGSVVSRINSCESDETDSIFRLIYSVSRRINRESDGYFDPTLAPLIEAYGFAGKEGKFPDGRATDSIMGFVGLDKTDLKGNRIIKKDNRVRFNFSAIAKGYGCDAVAEMFRRNGCEDYMVEIGGEIALGGKSPGDGKWRIQVDKPLFSSDTVIHESQEVIGLTDSGIATSGNYRNYRPSADGKNIGHTFDPHDGKPAQNDMLSATIVANTCMEADAYATACMAMGFEKAKEMADRQNLRALLITSDGTVWMNEAFRRLIVKN